MKHLVELPNAKTHLSLWKADLDSEGSFDEAIMGCDGVFHVATPMDFESKDPEVCFPSVSWFIVIRVWNIFTNYGIGQNEVIKPTINGMLDILNACKKAKTVKRVVFTSSAGTMDVEQHKKPVYDETCWSDLDFVRSVKMTGWVYIYLSIYIYTHMYIHNNILVLILT